MYARCLSLRQFLSYCSHHLYDTTSHRMPIDRSIDRTLSRVHDDDDDDARQQQPEDIVGLCIHSTRWTTTSSNLGVSRRLLLRVLLYRPFGAHQTCKQALNWSGCLYICSVHACIVRCTQERLLQHDHGQVRVVSSSCLFHRSKYCCNKAVVSSGASA